ncbi:DEAD/DEAH box helicase [Chryseobacterium indoltheticum]|uniref:DEAD/DEAH box helicase n=1 Tax=Chryseobacterium indoltheticum TaxID=254 RepID=UPI003F4961F6
MHRYPYYNWGYNHDDRLKNLTDFWDYLIIDEASMITLPYITFACMCAMQKNKNTKIIIAGDPKQIPPIPELSDADLELINVKTENIYSMFELDSFDSDKQNLTKRDIDTILNLPIQYRSVPEIGDVFSEFSYNSKVISNRKSSELRPFNQKIGSLFTRAVNFVSVPLKSEDPLYAHTKLIYSSYHIYTTILVAEILKFIEEHIGDEIWTIGIISPYKAQAILISKLIGDFGFEGKIKITADTVHGFQGDQCDIIFYLVTPNGHRYSGDP